MTRSARVVLSLTLALVAISFGVRGQGRPPAGAASGAPTETPPATGVILGRVIDADSGRPVPGAMVILGGGPRPAAAAAATADLLLAQQLALAGGRGGGPAQPTPVMTSAEGRFLFRELGRGAYNLSVQAPGYAPGVYGRARPDGPPRGIDLAQDERLTDVVVRVWKYAIVSGIVSDETGEPVVGASVRALRRMPVGGTGQRLQPGPAATTDDRGMYRLSTLLPGDYLIAVPSTITTMPLAAVDQYQQSISSGDMQTMSRERLENGSPMPSTGIVVGDHQLQAANFAQGPSVEVRADGRVAVYPTTFYPSAMSAAAATTLTLASGEERHGADLQIRLVPGVRVSGTAVGPDGPAKNIGVRLVPANVEMPNATGFETATTAADTSGRFTFLGVTPGSYVVSMSRVPRPEFLSALNMTILNGVPVTSGAAGAPAQAGPSYWAEQTLNVGADDVDGVTITMHPGADVAGHLEFEGTAPRPPAQRLQALTVTLTPADGRALSALGTPPARADAEGRFKTSGYPPGRYWLNITAPGAQWSIKSVAVNGANALAQPIELTSAPISGVVVTFTDRVAQLTGTVQGDPAVIDGASIVIFPADVQAWIERGMSPRLQYSAIATKTGSFQARIPIAGEYFVAALSPETSVDNTATFFAALARVATRITLSEGDARSLALPVSRLR